MQVVTKGARQRVKTSRRTSYQKLGGSKVPPATPVRPGKAPISYITLVPQSGQKRVVKGRPDSVSKR